MIAARSISHVRLPRRSERSAAIGAGKVDPLESNALSISIIVPVLNEAAIIAPFLRHLRESAPDAELIVVDGGSHDATRALADPLCDRLVLSGPGRAQQLNNGARAAGGQVFWFLHADSAIPRDGLKAIRDALAKPDAAGGYFRIRLPATHLIYRLTDSFAHYAGLVLRVRCGDHGLFCRQSLFFQSGGYPEVPLMEDVEFYRKLHGLGRVRAVQHRLTTSTRRYEQFGRVRVTFVYGLLALLYAVRVPLRTLAAIYARTLTASR